MPKKTSQIKLKYKKLLEFSMKKYSDEKELEEYTITTKVDWKDFPEEEYCEVYIRALIAPPVDRSFDSVYKIGYSLDEGKLSEEELKELASLPLEDFNYLFMTMTQQLTGDYITSLPRPEMEQLVDD